jgi:hypothetical protein
MKRLLLALLLCSCTTDPATGKLAFDKAKTARIATAVGGVALNDLGKIAIGELAGLTAQVASGSTSKADLQQGAATYAWQSISNINLASDLATVLAAAKADPAVVSAASNTFNTIAPQIGTQKAVNAIAMTISTAAQ